MTGQHQHGSLSTVRMSSEYYGYRNGQSVSSAGTQYRHKARKGKVPDQGLSNGLIILVIAIVVGCFAVLWPKYFYPMLFGKIIVSAEEH